MAWYKRDRFEADPIGWGENQLGRAAICFLSLPVAVFAAHWCLGEYPVRWKLHIAWVLCYVAYEVISQGFPRGHKGVRDILDDSMCWTLVGGLVLWSFLEVSRSQLTLEPQLWNFVGWLSAIVVYAVVGAVVRWVQMLEARGDR